MQIICICENMILNILFVNFKLPEELNFKYPKDLYGNTPYSILIRNLKKLLASSEAPHKFNALNYILESTHL